jgi:hypothetical protein
LNKTGPEITREIEEREKKEAIQLLSQQLGIEKQLVSLYEEKEQTLQSQALREEKAEIIKELTLHLDLEKKAIATANKVLKNIWIRQNQGLEVLIKKWRDNEVEHHTTLKTLMDKRFFRMDPYSLGSLFRDTNMDQLEASYKRSKRIQKYLRTRQDVHT